MKKHSSNNKKGQVYVPKARSASIRTATKKAVQKAKKGYAPGLLGSIGHSLGGMTGIPLLSKLGRRAGNWLGSVTGMGAYRFSPRHNSLVSKNGAPPAFQGHSNITLRRTEFIQDIVGSDVFTVQKEIYINPGNPDWAPVGYKVAEAYVEYDLKGCVFEFRSTSSNSTTDPVVGTVLMCTQPDLFEPNFTTKQQMEMHDQRSVDKPSVTFMHGVECDPSQRALKCEYIRGTSIPTGADPLFYDWGRFTIATCGQGTSYESTTTPPVFKKIGELWVTYDVVLRVPKLPDAIPPSALQLQATHWISTPPGTAEPPNPQGTGGYVSTSGSDLVATIANSYVELPNTGNYFLMFCITHGTAMTLTSSFVTGSNVTPSPVFQNYTTTALGVMAANDCQYLTVYRFAVTAGVGASNRVYFPTFTGSSSTTGDTDVFLMQIPLPLQAPVPYPKSIRQQLVDLQSQLVASNNRLLTAASTPAVATSTHMGKFTDELLTPLDSDEDEKFITVSESTLLARAISKLVH